jgi:hypothetical protein
MMERTGAVAEKLFSKDSIIAVTVFFCETLLRYASLLTRLLHHSLRKNKLIPPVEVSL